jgi:hypothetical protein
VTWNEDDDEETEFVLKFLEAVILAWIIWIALKG